MKEENVRKLQGEVIASQGRLIEKLIDEVETWMKIATRHSDEVWELREQIASMKKGEKE